jgi:hypothetical protein
MTVHRFQTVLGAQGSGVFIETRRRRVEQAVAMLRDGRRHP